MEAVLEGIRALSVSDNGPEEAQSGAEEDAEVRRMLRAMRSISLCDEIADVEMITEKLEDMEVC